ncbi:uncharacterized protein EI97DRAFT_195595 [Westerdykella ornata]|uniref:Sm domain-containing protein n=1 Tax=Westerdykella ornata TaxID=318751 RepID=A0A6A6JBD3_WESOR|nr:uncharacterized protein EI97DRAFT_195595 [Westerdykella ornata]KAF2272946.1 hypothetical protein EI97DRAFT_195595 [Westerdykella ornata]
MSFPHHQTLGGPAGPAQNVPMNFNAMLQRSAQEQGYPVPQSQGLPGAIQNAQAPGFGPLQGPGSAPFAPNTLGRPPPPSTVLPGDLPPQAFLTSSMLLDMVDKKVDVLLRDEKEYIGILRSYDQFANLVLTECFERIAARNPDAEADPTVPKWLACDVECPGVMTIRGENVTICATVDLDREDDPVGLRFVPAEVVRALVAEQKAKKALSDARIAKALKRAGMEPNQGMQG